MKFKPFYGIAAFVALLNPLCSYSQAYISANDLQDVKEIKSSILSSENNTDLIKTKFPINQINGETYISFVAKAKPDFNPDALRSLGCIVNPTISQLVTLKIPKRINIGKEISFLKNIFIAYTSSRLF